ncbi:cupin domain-containing protein [Ohessyouella blattaphilus]|uniref:Cupin domain-containing protein n=1 Tax=Ohessyouella blattaphilus TaxID=2949333 RepID=A0ABT1EN65_9FIRM|nr:cupin domain-containing protein [Ohessyouella blattaphilus]MCP1111151.1 cupin domain-containing protein [Ohessyouella blattaphilus]MCR8564545.1 cupin domain-containing protein [Ohessyouella blattaphilus]
MTKKEYVQQYGGKFNINEGEVWTMPNGHDVHFTLTPKVGSLHFNIATGWHIPGKEFAPHVHPVSAELLVVYEGEGECFLGDKWIPCKKGDVIYAPPGVYHGTRNPATNTEEFVTLGIATPPQLDLYTRAAYDVMDDDKSKFEPEW